MSYFIGSNIILKYDCVFGKLFCSCRKRIVIFFLRFVGGIWRFVVMNFSSRLSIGIFLFSVGIFFEEEKVVINRLIINVCGCCGIYIYFFLF